MEFKRLDDSYVQIIPKEVPIKTILEAIARQIYSGALVFTPWETGTTPPTPEEVARQNFSQYFTFKPVHKKIKQSRGFLGMILGEPKLEDKLEKIGEELTGLDMKSPNKRTCKAKVIKKDGKWLFVAKEYETTTRWDKNMNRTTMCNAEKLLEEVQYILCGNS